MAAPPQAYSPVHPMDYPPAGGVRYSAVPPPGGHVDHMAVPPVVYPYPVAAAPGHAPVFAPVAPLPPRQAEGMPVPAGYGHGPYGPVPMSMAMSMPPNVAAARGMVATPDLLMEHMERLSLNPMAKEFVPPNMRGGQAAAVAAAYSRGFAPQRGGQKGSGQPPVEGRKVGKMVGIGMPGTGATDAVSGGGSPGGNSDGTAANGAAGVANGANAAAANNAGANSGSNNGRMRTRKRRSRRSRNQQQALQENIRRTIYISDIDQQVTEEQLAGVFSDSGVVVDCRVCGDPNSAMRFAFIEFLNEEAATAALKKNGCDLGASRLRVLPSKTAIVPVNKELMPKNKEEMEQCSRTVYATNIDKKVDRNDVKRFFEALCGPVQKLRLLGDHAHSTRIAFVEFSAAESALAALSCSGALLGTMPIRVSPSKTPVRFCGSHEKE